IDRVFVSSLSEDSSDMAITKAIIAMAHSLSLKTVAEGVEKVEQLEFLRELECDEVQGYLFSEPLPANKITHLLAEDNRLCA
ncbi:MAG: EAL domain-containing protein, partial [Actinomycetota bacterium]|nr:EAL domain-containing protein [Actinomycetota bacterium]